MVSAVQACLVSVNVLLLIFRGIVRLFGWQKSSLSLYSGGMQMRLGQSWLPWRQRLNIFYQFRPTCKINRVAQWIQIEGGWLASSFSPHFFLLFTSFLTTTCSLFVSLPFSPSVFRFSHLLFYLHSLLCFVIFFRSETLHLGPLPWRMGQL